MYCPLCGNKLSEVERPNHVFDGVDEWNELTIVKDDTVWLECKVKQCFGPTFPLVWHHPHKGIRSAPGDSWSLTWEE
jgi:hypothetical protein